jgi:hypothetical protein
MLRTLVLATYAFVVLDGAEYLGAKQAIALGYAGAGVDGVWVFHFAIGRSAYSVWRVHGVLNLTKPLDSRELSEYL